MIHLDRNHSSTIARHSKPANLILSNPPHPDQHQILSWASPTRDARPYYQESQEQFLTDTPSKLSVQSDIAPIPDLSSQPSSLGPITPGDAEDPKLPEPSPSSPADPRSPPADSSSSLTPPPDASTSPVAAENADEPPGRSSVQRRAEATPETPAESASSLRRQISMILYRQFTPSSPSCSPTAPDLTAKQTTADGDKPIGAVGSSSIPDPAPQKDATRPSNADMPSSSHTPASPVAVSPSGPALDPKVVSILELNSLLLRISMEFQSRGVQMNDPKYNQYAIRLQSNLTWLAAAADESHKVSPGTAPLPSLPMMQPPPPVEMPQWVEYRRYTPNCLSVLNGNAKRERTEEPAAPLANKRRDTGESKAPTPIAPAPPVSAPSSSQSLPILAPS
ncbi:hypothetical protein A0H81_08085 [Grifola frondosa]|uniref:Uncharacterized protein n=1 Tax=Grifola frondosa TaxID=5627 RepID=A0A1C7M4W4_GRIFR|nr:hypothetical protein A0H81_08085 [Grifola frondosa]